jgi:hypothetical protein
LNAARRSASVAQAAHGWINEWRARMQQLSARSADDSTASHGPIFVIFEPCRPIPAISPFWPKMNA